VIVELDPERLQEFLGTLTGQGADRDLFLVKRIQVLIQSTRVESIPGVQFGNYADVNKPVVLQGFPKSLRRLGWNALANLGHLL